MILTAALPPIVDLLNVGVHNTPEAADLCSQLDGRSLVTRIEGLPTGPLAIRLSATFDGIDIRVIDAAASADTADADATIAGTPLELQRLMFVDRDAPIRAGRVLFDGDIEVAEKFRTLLMTARPDLESRLAEWLGEPVAFPLLNFAHDFRDWVRDAADDLVDWSGEYLRDDARRVPAREEVDEFCASVDDVANDVDRLAARIARLNDGERK